MQLAGFQRVWSCAKISAAFYMNKKGKVLMKGKVRRVAWSLLLSVGLLLLAIHVWSASQDMTDFCQDYVAASNVLQGHSPYALLRCWLSVAINVPVSQEYDAHPPPSVLLVLPLAALLPRSSATLIWGFFCLVAYLLAGWLLLKGLTWQSLASTALFIAGSVIWPLSRYALAYMNIEPLLLLLLVIAWLVERRGHVRWAGFLIGLAGLLKLWPAALLLGAVVQRRWSLVSTGVITFITGSVATLLILGPQSYLVYLGPVQANEQKWALGETNASLESVVARLFMGYREPSYAIPVIFHGLTLGQATLLGEIVAGCLLVGVLLFLWWCHRYPDSDATRLLSGSLLMTVLLVVFPVIWYPGLILLLLPCVMLTLVLREWPRPPAWWFLALYTSLLELFGADWLIAQYAGVLFQGPPTILSDLATLLFALPTAALLLFAGLQAWLLWQVSISARGQHRGEELTEISLIVKATDA